MNTEELSFDIIQHFIKEKGLINHQIEGYNDFIRNGINKTFEEENKIVLREDDKKFVYKFEHPIMESPKLVDDSRIIREYTPMEARFRDISYHGALRVDLVSEEYSSDDKLISSTTQHRLILAHIPVMIGSDICNLKRMSKLEIKNSGECISDDGGYFIVKGKERVIIAQERANYNTINVYKNSDNSYYSEVRSMSEETGHSALTQCILPVNQRGMYFNLPCISQKINVGVVFMALGLDENNIKDILTPKNIYDTLNEKERRQWDKLITYIIRDSWFVREEGEPSVDKANEYISTFVNTVSETPIEYTKQVLYHELFPHMSISCDIEEYIWFLSRMIVKMFMTYLGKRPEDDKDHYTNKRVEGVGTLMTDLFRTSFKRFIRNVLYHMQKQQNISYIISKVNNISKDIKYCFSTGNWGLQKTAYVRTGVSQVLARLSYTSTISHLRRVIVPVGKEVKNSEIRQIHQSSTFFLCPAECFDPETPILMASGKVKPAKEIIVGDMLIGGDGKMTRVKSTCSGVKNMYEVKQKNGMNYTVTDNHILTLKIKGHGHVYHGNNYEVSYLDKKEHVYKYKSFETVEEANTFVDTVGEDIIDITIEDYLKLTDAVRDNLYGFRCEGVEWEKKDVEMDPYSLGTRLGDGFISNNKHIPLEYLVNDRDTRLKVLAGFIDADGIVRAGGREVYIMQNSRNKRVLDGVLFLVRSLGFSCDSRISDYNTYYELIITGEKLHEIPTILKHKQLRRYTDEKTNMLQTSIEVSEKGLGKFVGWQLENDGRFLLEDFTVVHNTPEGAPVGIVKNFALTTTISNKIPGYIIKNILDHDDIPGITDNKASTPIFLNGRVYGFTDDYASTLEYIRDLRTHFIIPQSVSISYSKYSDEIRIFSDEGRMMRPLIYLGDDFKNFDFNSKYTFDELIHRDIIRYLDPTEIENEIIAMTPNDIQEGIHTYMEIHPVCMLGVVGVTIPYPDHNQAPRVCYYSSMNKQTIGYYASNNTMRTDTTVHQLDYFQKPLVTTRVGDMIKNSDMPAGMNCIVAIMPEGLKL